MSGGEKNTPQFEEQRKSLFWTKRWIRLKHPVCKNTDSHLALVLTLTCLNQVSIFFRWALVKWSQFRCFRVAANTLSIWPTCRQEGVQGYQSLGQGHSYKPEVIVIKGTRERLRSRFASSLFCHQSAFCFVCVWCWQLTPNLDLLFVRLLLYMLTDSPHVQHRNKPINSLYCVCLWAMHPQSQESVLNFFRLFKFCYYTACAKLSTPNRHQLTAHSLCQTRWLK